MLRNIPISVMKLRREWLMALGGLDGVSVHNKEWLNLLEEDTRQSLMIEGYFVDRRELREIVANKQQNGNKVQKVLGYFDAALFSYDFAFQQFRTGEFNLSKALIRQMHSLMFRGDEHYQYPPAGEWRKSPIVISGAKITPPAPSQIDEEIEKLVTVINRMKSDPVKMAALAHASFEQIHPFPDGNGRVGRILMNFILVAHGFPNIAIKGESEDERSEYFAALESADKSVNEVLSGKLKYGEIEKNALLEIEEMVNKNLAVAVDNIICGRFETKTGQKLISIDEVAGLTGKNANSFRVACSQKKFINAKVDGMQSHPWLLGSPKI